MKTETPDVLTESAGSSSNDPSAFCESAFGLKMKKSQEIEICA